MTNFEFECLVFLLYTLTYDGVGENAPVPERPLPYTPLLGLQGRLAIGGTALIPTNHAELKTGFTDESIPKTVALMEKAVNERARCLLECSTRTDKRRTTLQMETKRRCKKSPQSPNQR